MRCQGGSTINVCLSSTRLDMRKWVREIQTGFISGAFRAFRDKAAGRGEKPDAMFSFNMLVIVRKKKSDTSLSALEGDGERGPVTTQMIKEKAAYDLEYVTLQHLSLLT